MKRRDERAGCKALKLARFIVARTGLASLDSGLLPLKKEGGGGGRGGHIAGNEQRKGRGGLDRGCRNNISPGLFRKDLKRALSSRFLHKYPRDQEGGREGKRGPLQFSITSCFLYPRYEIFTQRENSFLVNYRRN